MFSRKRIVAVDDSSIVLKMLKSALRKELFDLHAFSTGARALEFLEQGEKIPDLIILDIEMPIMNGYDVLKQIKRMDHLKDVPVIFLTSDGEKRQVMKAVTDGVKDYVVKPIDQEALAKRIFFMLQDEPAGDTKNESVDSAENESAGDTEDQSADNAENEPADDTEGGGA